MAYRLATIPSARSHDLQSQCSSILMTCVTCDCPGWGRGPGIFCALDHSATSPSFKPDTLCNSIHCVLLPSRTPTTFQWSSWATSATWRTSGSSARTRAWTSRASSATAPSWRLLPRPRSESTMWASGCLGWLFFRSVEKHPGARPLRDPNLN